MEQRNVKRLLEIHLKKQTFFAVTRNYLCAYFICYLKLILLHFAYSLNNFKDIIFI